MKKRRKNWTTQEKELLKKIYPTASWDEMLTIFNTGKDGITHKASQLGLKREMVNFAKYKPEEISFIKNNYGIMPTKFIAEELGRTQSAICCKAQKLKVLSRSFWTEEEKNLLKAIFPKYGNEEISELYFNNRSPNAIQNMAIKMDLHKDYIPSQKQKQFNKEDLIKEIKEVYKKIGRTPLLTELRLYGLPSERTLSRYFKNGYIGLCKELGWKQNHNFFGKTTNYYSKNGDLCFSLSEMIITDFFIENDINYKKDELLYRDIFGYEEFGEKRIDWLLKYNDEIFVVEFFGMMGNKKYEEKVQNKLDLCKKYNVPLISIYPNDMKDLPVIFEKFIKHK